MRRRPTKSLRVLGLSALGLTSGCNRDACEGEPAFEQPPLPNPGPDDPPTVIGGRWIEPTVLEVQFSAPITATGEVDPRRFAVLGWVAYHESYSYFGFGRERCYGGTSYAALPYEGGLPVGESITEVWIAPEDPTRLRLRLSDAGRCENLTDVPDGSGIMLIYTDAALAGSIELRDEAGVRSPDIGPEWAVDGLERCLDEAEGCAYLGDFHSEFLPRVDSLAPIPCPYF